ncbi:MAG: ABC transporter ATP-binding protein [Lysobacteraceae bacterium]
MNAAVAFSNVSRRHHHFALENLSFQLEQGQIMGFVGPNGAGKTTTIRLLMALLRQDEGHIEVLGHAMPEDQVRAKQHIGYVCQDMGLIGGATLGWHMGFVKPMRPGWDDGYANALLKRFGLRTEQRVATLSHGERIKALLLLALAWRPRLLVLDEPTAGLDPVARHEVLGEFTDVLKDEERSILFSSHDTHDVEQISDQITFIDRGRLVASDDKEVFLERWRRLHLQLSESTALPALPGLVEAVRQGNAAIITLDAYAPELPALCQASGAQVCEVQRMTLEEIFVAIVMRQRRELEA